MQNVVYNMNLPCITAKCHTNVPGLREIAHQLGRKKCCTVKGARPQSELSGPIACLDIKSRKLLMGSYNNGYGTVRVHEDDNDTKLIESMNDDRLLPRSNDPRTRTAFTVCDGCAQTLQEKHGFQVVKESEFFPPRTEKETRVIEWIEKEENELRGIEQTYDECQDKIDQYHEKLETLEETMARKRKHIEDEMARFQKKRRGASGADSA